MAIRERIEHSVTLLSGMAIGAAVMYVFDEHRGAARRAYARDKVIRAGHRVGRGMNRQSRNLLHRALGSVAELRAKIRDRRGVSDDQLVRRVRSQLGHVVSHIGLVDIDAYDGHVRVSGPVLPQEIDKIRHRVAKTRGVKDCDLRVEPRTDLDVISGIRGAANRSRTAIYR
jgi:hypothetical protein